MEDSKGPKIGFGIRLEYQQKLIMTPKLIRGMSRKEAMARLVLPKEKKEKKE